MADADMRNRNATDILLSKMVKDGEIERVTKGRYCLSGENTGQIGQMPTGKTALSLARFAS